MATFKEQGWQLVQIKFRGKWRDGYVNPDPKAGYYLSVQKERESRKLIPSREKRPTGKYREVVLDGFGFRFAHESYIRTPKKPKPRKRSEK